MNITVIGTGYVGLVTGACFAEMGNSVTCVDIDSRKIEGLKLGVVPIYEPKLENLVRENFKEGRLSFTTSLAETLESSDFLFIAVGTPPGEDGSADLQYVLAVAAEIGRSLTKYTVVVDKSTVPIGTADKVSSIIKNELANRNLDISFDVVSNPEFLKEGAAVDDFMRPDRIIIGSDSDRAQKLMTELYAPFNRNHQRLVFMGARDAEMAKYAANAMLATKISFMNEISNLCEELDVDIENVRLGIGSDQRIGFHFIYPGAGYGGSCFPKDVKALINISEKNDFDPKILRAVEDRNNNQKKKVGERVKRHFKDGLRGRVFAVWGLAFKPGTDDMREAPSTVLISELLALGARVKAFDPEASITVLNEYASDIFERKQLEIVQDQYEALNGADALILMTEWKLFRNPDFKRIKNELRYPLIFDGRNQYDIEQMKRFGFQYYGIGRQSGVAL